MIISPENIGLLALAGLTGFLISYLVMTKHSREGTRILPPYSIGVVAVAIVVNIQATLIVLAAADAGMHIWLSRDWMDLQFYLFFQTVSITVEVATLLFMFTRG